MFTHSRGSQKTPAKEILYRECERPIPIQQTLVPQVSYTAVSGLAIQPKNHFRSTSTSNNSVYKAPMASRSMIKLKLQFGRPMRL